MIRSIAEVAKGFSIDADVVVVGSGAGGAVAAANCAAAGLRTVLLEAGAKVEPGEMTRDAPRFLARNYWEGGLRLIEGPAPIPSMQGRCLGGSTVVNSAIMFKLPDRVRRTWAEEDGLGGMLDPALDRAFERVFARTGVSATPMSIQGRRNTIVGDALTAMGLPNGPLPRAVVGCKGSGDCITGCFEGAKQSVDRSWIAPALADGLQVYTGCEVERVHARGRQVTGVSGVVIDPDGWRRLGRFTVNAPRVILAAGVMATPCILQRSGINPRGQAGATLHMHLSGGVIGMMEDTTHPWIGASQGWGAIVEDVPGLKLESLWAPPSLLAVRWGDVGLPWMRTLGDIRRAVPLVCVYAGRTSGSVKLKRNGLPRIRLRIPDEEVRPIQYAMKLSAEGLLKVGARSVYSAIPGLPDDLRTPAQTELILGDWVRPKHIGMTGNHVFSSVRMSASADRGPVDPEGRVRDVEGLWVADSSVFPGPSAVNPQATVMALADVISRRLAGLEA